MTAVSRVVRLFLLMFIATATAGFGFSSSAPKADPYWQTHNKASTTVVDHSVWDGFLKAHVRPGKDGVNRINYQKARADRAALKRYIAALEQVKVTDLNRNEQMAYWINLYNALTVLVVLDHYPVKTIRDIDISGLFSNGPWGKKLTVVEGRKLSLDDIEHKILRPIWRDPRVHYAVNCASIGCPNLAPSAYTSKTLDKALDQGARAYINSPRGVDVVSDRIVVSSIYSWFAYDFGNSEKGVMNHLRRYATGNRAAALKGIGKLSSTQYDWSLNDTK